MSHSFVYSPSNYAAVHSSGMKPFELIAALVQRSGTTLAVAKNMKDAGFQGTLHKFITGQVRTPERSTAETIARHFGLPVDALYDTTVSRRLARELGLLDGTAIAMAREPSREEPPRPAVPLSGPFSAATHRRIASLSPEQCAQLELLIVVHLDAVAPKPSAAKRKRA